MRTAVLFLLLLLSGLTKAQAANKAVMEGVYSSNSTVLVSTRTGRLITTGLRVSSAAHVLGTITVISSASFISDVLIRGPEPWIDVKAYGANGDGTDDSSVIQSAINAAQTARGTVYFPYTANGYGINTSLTISGGVKLKGQPGTIISALSDITIATFTAPSGYCVVEDLQFNGPAVASTNPGIYVTKSNHNYLSKPLDKF